MTMPPLCRHALYAAVQKAVFIAASNAFAIRAGIDATAIRGKQADDSADNFHYARWRTEAGRQLA